MLWEHITSLKTYTYSYVYTCSTLAYFAYRYSNIGVKQCDPSSSLLCLFFLNDIIQHINTDKDGIMTLEIIKLHLLFFADDAVLFCAKSPLITMHGIWRRNVLYHMVYGAKCKKNQNAIFSKEDRPFTFLYL